MKYLVVLLCFFSICCKNTTQEKIDVTDEMVTARVRETMNDTTGMYLSPVKIIESKIVKGDYSKQVRLKYKNISGKDIDAIRFAWQLKDAFDEYIGDEFSHHGGYVDDKLKTGSTIANVWDTNNRAKKIESIRVTQVAFTDGTKWEL